MKKIFAFMLAMALAASMLAACGGSSSSTAQTYVDGTYRAESYDFSRGYKEFMEVTFAGDVITDVVFDAMNETDPTLFKSMLTIEEYPMFDAEGNDFNPAVWYPTLEESILAAKTAEDIELIAGATHTAENARIMFAAILEAAKTGATDIIVVGAPVYIDGTYRVEQAAFSHGYKEFMEVTYAGGVVTNVVYDAVSETDPTVFKSQLTIEEYAMFDAEGNDFHPAVWYPTLIANIMAAEKPADIEIIAAATHTSENARIFLALIQEAAVAGNTEVILYEEPVVETSDDTATSGDTSTAGESVPATTSSGNPDVSA